MDIDQWNIFIDLKAKNAKLFLVFIKKINLKKIFFTF